LSSSGAVRAAKTDDVSAPSPAIALQHELERQWRARAGIQQAVRWSPKATLAFSGALGLTLWAAIAAAALAALK
jgi:hypothetical protein